MSYDELEEENSFLYQEIHDLKEKYCPEILELEDKLWDKELELLFCDDDTESKTIEAEIQKIKNELEKLK